MSALKKTHVIALFAHMQHQFGHKWVSVYGAATAGEDLSPAARMWFNDLSAYSAEVVADAITTIKGRRMEWPPSCGELMDLCEGVPTVEQILDRRTDYGPLCAEIRRGIDWFNVDGMAADKAAKAVASKREGLIGKLRRTGEMAALVERRHLAITGDRPQLAAIAGSAR